MRRSSNASAAATSSTPAPQPRASFGDAKGRALATRTSRAVAGSRGQARCTDWATSNAHAADTNGAAKLVPVTRA